MGCVRMRLRWRCGWIRDSEIVRVECLVLMGYMIEKYVEGK